MPGLAFLTEGSAVQAGVRNSENFSRRSIPSQGPAERTEAAAASNGATKAKPQVETARKRKAAKLQVTSLFTYTATLQLSQNQERRSSLGQVGILMILLFL